MHMSVIPDLWGSALPGRRESGYMGILHDNRHMSGLPQYDVNVAFTNVTKVTDQLPVLPLFAPLCPILSGYMGI
jgi:hypothetical protein